MCETHFYFIYSGVFEWRTTDRKESVWLLFLPVATRWRHKPRKDQGEPEGSTVLRSYGLQIFRLFFSSTESQFEGHLVRTVKVMVGVCLCLPDLGLDSRFFSNVQHHFFQSIKKCLAQKKSG